MKVARVGITIIIIPPDHINMTYPGFKGIIVISALQDDEYGTESYLLQNPY